MIITPEIDLTPESAATLERFRQLFHGGRFTGLALIGGLGTTDIQTLWRTMDRVVGVAAGYQLCTTSEPMTPYDRAEAAKQALEDLKALAHDWYDSLDAAQQQAVIDLLRSIVAWLQSLAAQLSPEAQAVLDALKALLGVLLVEQAKERKAR
jgi:hypothetical protein